MTRFKEIILNKKNLFLVYGALIVLSCLGFESKFYIPFYLGFAFFIGWLYFFGEEGKGLKLSRWLIIIPLIIILLIRVVPFFFSEAPLGYDTGIYKKNIEDFSTALPNLPQVSEGAWLEKEPWGLYLSTNLLSLIGLSSNQILYGYYILLSLLLGIAIYVLVKEFFNENAAICSLFIFALSLTQFQTYWMMYYKNIAGLFLMLIAFYLLHRKSWLVIPVAGFLGGLHHATFLIFGLAMLVHFIFNKDKKYHLISGIGALVIAFSLYLYNPQAIFQFLSFNLQELVKTLGPGTGGGTFFDFGLYRQIITFYLPFAILGFIYLIKKKKFNYLFFYFILNFIIIYFNFFFHNRFIIHFDIIVIILAGAGMSFILGKFLSNLTGKAAIGILLIGAVYILGTVVLNKKPLISDEELAEIKSLPVFVGEDKYVMATDSFYSPWLYGYSERKTIAPGLFEHNKWNKEKWAAFWFSPDLELRYFLLDEYEGPIYLFVGDRQPQMDFSDDPRFIKISERIWKYE
jgi:hypothetical protein